MAYDPVTGKWTDEDTSVEKRLTGLLDKDSPYLKQAETIGKQQANRRGLLNSTMAVTGIEDARIRAALPIASQEAGQAHEREISGRSLQSSDIQQNRSIDAQRGMQERDIEYQRGAQTRDIESRGTMQAADLNAQQRIAEMNVASAERNQASGLIAALEQNYSQLISSITGNADIPAASRQQYLDHAARTRDSTMALVEQLYGIDLVWSTAAPAAVQPAIGGGAAAAPAAIPSGRGGFGTVIADARARAGA